MTRRVRETLQNSQELLRINGALVTSRKVEIRAGPEKNRHVELLRSFDTE